MPYKELSSGFQSVMATAPVPVLVKDGEGVYVFANAAAEALLGYKAGEIGGLNILDLVENEPSWLAAEFQRFKTDRVWIGNLLFRQQAGGRVLGALNAFSLPAPDGTLYAALVHPLGANNTLGTNNPLGAARRSFGISYSLTSSELRILQLLADNFTDRDIASVLGLRDWAVTREISLTLQKMGVASRTEACVRAIKAALIF
jgi:PAS domain S-box-containing protein